MRSRTRVVSCLLTALALAAPATPALAQPAQPGAAAATTAATAGPAISGAGDSPGDLVSVEPSAFHPLPGQPTATRAWKIHYRSTSATDEPNVVSGTVIVPQDGRTGPRPLVSYAVGTVGMADSCAPSAGFPHGTTVEANLIQALTWRGWAVVVTDYEGLGTPGDHTYTVGRSAGHSVLDAARAALRLPEAGLDAHSPVGLMGYSQGGQASSWAAELKDSYAPELDVRGTVSGGVPARLAEMPAVHDGSFGAGLMFMSALGQDTAYPELKLDDYLNDRGRKLVSTLRNSCVALGALAGAFTKISDITTENPLVTAAWQNRLHASDLGTRDPGHPVYLYHALPDEIVPYAQGSGLRRAWCTQGADVEWHTTLIGEHVSTVVTESLRAANWLGDRFNGRATHSNC
ncbi:lipase family protein [Streptomyces sp. LP05-1]|uniref:Lipase family protein n=1 Tax=Streptomyces pyxinae TaxID=2970734 RepID=A0ABT2CNV5_9ACTN|nr:lipase family protein [Streptomyces sp. LP05-1]MCS0639110.1 lipase family protein [Streptomyces sp. LP05-1]